MKNTLNLFYQEPDPDRWVPLDRYPRKWVRRLVRGKRRPGGQEMVFINLMKGLDKLQVNYRVNDFSYARNHQEELACIIGKPHLLFDGKWKNPILFGSSLFSHPLDCPNLFEIYPKLKSVLVPGDWMKKMFQEYYPENVLVWPTGIDTEAWKPVESQKNKILIYDKIYWDRAYYSSELLQPIQDKLHDLKIPSCVIRYGFYKPEELKKAAIECNAAIVLSRGETQGFAYQQLLSAGLPVFSWDLGGYWQDPAYYPHKVKFQSISSVPYWDERCGMKFKDYTEFEQFFSSFWEKVQMQKFQPRNYILENLTLEQCAQKYLDIIKEVS